MTLIGIPLKNNELHVPTDLDLAIWEACYPGLDVYHWLRHIAAWNYSNPTRRKTKRGINKHINAWLQSEHKKLMAGVKDGTQARLDVPTWTRKALGC